MEPLFSAQPALLARLRMSGVCKTQGDALAFIDDCILDAHLQMRTAFGTSQLGVYRAITPPTSAPVSEDDYTFYQLRKLEDLLVEKCLMVRMTQLAMEGSAGSQEYYDRESPYRLMTSDDMREKYNQLCDRIAEAYAGLATTEEFESRGTMSAVTLGPDCTAPSVQGLGADLSPSVCGGEVRAPWHLH